MLKHSSPKYFHTITAAETSLSATGGLAAYLLNMMQAIRMITPSRQTAAYPFKKLIPILCVGDPPKVDSGKGAIAGCRIRGYGYVMIDEADHLKKPVLDSVFASVKPLHIPVILTYDPHRLLLKDQESGSGTENVSDNIKVCELVLIDDTVPSIVPVTTPLIVPETLTPDPAVQTTPAIVVDVIDESVIVNVSVVPDFATAKVVPEFGNFTVGLT